MRLATLHVRFTDHRTLIGPRGITRRLDSPVMLRFKAAAVCSFDVLIVFLELLVKPITMIGILVCQLALALLSFATLVFALKTLDLLCLPTLAVDDVTAESSTQSVLDHVHRGYRGSSNSDLVLQVTLGLTSWDTEFGSA